MTTLNVFYYDDDRYNSEEVHAMAAELLKTLPQYEIDHTVVLPKSCQFVQYPLTNDEYYQLIREEGVK